MFLRALGVPFSADELIWVPDGQDPPDVRFREARFEVRELLEKGRRRYDEKKARPQQFRKAETIEDAGLERHDKIPMSYSEVYALLLAALAEKASRYGARGCAMLDALVCIQLNRFLLPTLPVPDYTALLQQGWRSISFVMPLHSHVVYATEAAPAFLREYVGQTRRKWDDPYHPGTFFGL
jgi:hypothetical protein